MPNDQLALPTQLASELKLSAEWLRQEARAGRLPHLPAGDTILFNRDAVREALARRAAGQTDQNETAAEQSDARQEAAT